MSVANPLKEECNTSIESLKQFIDFVKDENNFMDLCVLYGGNFVYHSCIIAIELLDIKLKELNK